MAKSGMNPKALQYLMGHSDISVTLNTYTHVNLEDAREEVAKKRQNLIKIMTILGKFFNQNSDDFVINIDLICAVFGK